MSSISIKQENSVENYRMYSSSEEYGKYKVEHQQHPPLQMVEPQQIAQNNEENVQVVPHSDKGADSPTPPPTGTLSKTTYTCNHCGKKYKHRNCLVKHLWEHHESWELCLKFNLTKHQQVQMMEAAQILVDLACIKQH
ncbi:8271_t:CDS:2 [Ambispora leptoticha]|uniref:8271_t:CDS:1 n=1 Tax=Ambispora leptoticha TaxID=144679 RepID=A0A9N9GSX1_9GLOM|nr:8271_t:CDS:2 [Ambispora leptoticha]